jgi:hypothetical protein
MGWLALWLQLLQCCCLLQGNCCCHILPETHDHQQKLLSLSLLLQQAVLLQQAALLAAGRPPGYLKHQGLLRALTHSTNGQLLCWGMTAPCSADALMDPLLLPMCW